MKLTLPYSAPRWLACLLMMLAATCAGAQTDAPPRPAPDSRMVFVSPDGDDANTGFSPDQAVATVARGLALLRTGKPDWLLLQRDAGYELSANDIAQLGSDESTAVITAYGEGTLPRLYLKDDARDTLLANVAAGQAQVHGVAVVPFDLTDDTPLGGGGGGGGPAPVIHTHHPELQNAYPGEVEPMVVIVDSDFNYTYGSPPPTRAQIDAAFLPGARAYEKVMRAAAENALIVDDCEWMPGHYHEIDRPAIDAAIEARLYVVSHIRRLAPGLRIAMYNTVVDPWLGVVNAHKARGEGELSTYSDAAVAARQQRWDTMWAIYNEHLIPAYDAITLNTYARVRHADYYPLEPERWWALEDWLPAHIQQSKQTGVPVIAFVWYRFSSALPGDVEQGYFPLADPAYLSELVRILRDEEVNEMALWMAWDDPFDAAARTRVDLITDQFTAP